MTQAPVQLKPIEEIAASIGVPAGRLSPYGRFMAKVDHRLLHDLRERPEGRLIVVTSMSPAPAGAGKTTLTIGLAQALRLLGHGAIACIRQPSLGPFFGAKGGATGSGRSMVHPADDIALHFTGDDHAAATAHNLIASLIDNHIYHGNRLGIDPERIEWRRVSVLSDRALRRVRVNAAEAGRGRDEEFGISASSEIMSAACLSLTLAELKARIGRMLLAFDKAGSPVFAGALKAAGAASALLRSILDPNLVQSSEGAPVFVHGTPFGNVSLGCSSLIATKLALRLARYCITEAGFSTELGAEKFFDIKCRAGGLAPSAVVIAASLRALRLHGGATDFNRSDAVAGARGLDNLRKHCENIAMFGLPFIVALNRFSDDPEQELDAVIAALGTDGIPACLVDVRDRGGPGGAEAASAIVRLCEKPGGFKFLYPDAMPVAEKIRRIAVEMYGADGVVFVPAAASDIDEIERLGCGSFPVCIAKTPKSLSDDPARLGRPRGFYITVRRVYPAVGAGFVVALCGGVLLMPGLPEHPLAESIDVDADARVSGV